MQFSLLLYFTSVSHGYTVHKRMTNPANLSSLGLFGDFLQCHVIHFSHANISFLNIHLASFVFDLWSSVDGPL